MSRKIRLSNTAMIDGKIKFIINDKIVEDIVIEVIIETQIDGKKIFTHVYYKTKYNGFVSDDDLIKDEKEELNYVMV